MRSQYKLLQTVIVFANQALIAISNIPHIHQKSIFILLFFRKRRYFLKNEDKKCDLLKFKYFCDKHSITNSDLTIVFTTFQ